MLANPGLLPRTKRSRLFVSAALVVPALLAAVAVPIPHRVFCPAEIVPADASGVYAETPGVLIAVRRRLGEAVQTGTPIVTLETLERNQFQDPDAVLEIAVLQKALAASRELLAERQADVRRLEICSPATGIILPPPENRAAERSEGSLPGWSGDVFEPRNGGCFLEQGTLLCRIGDPHRLEAELVVEHADYELVAVGQRVKISLEALPGRPMSGVITELGEANLEATPKRLSHVGGGELASKTDRSGVERPRHVSYYARVALDSANDFELLRSGVRGRAKIDVGTDSLYGIVDRYLRKLFTFRL